MCGVSAMSTIKLSIDDLELTALKRQDRTASVKHNGLWLTVTCTSTRLGSLAFTYRYGRADLTRDGARIVLDDG